MTIYADIFSGSGGTLPPSVPTTFTENTGSAIPALNNINILGGTGITTSGSGSTVTISATGSAATLSPYIVGATNSDFTSIEAALAAAVIAGMNANNQMHFLIKPGTYTPSGGTLTIPDGANLFAFGGANATIQDATQNGASLPVIISGNIGVPDNSQFKMTNIQVNAGTAVAFHFTLTTGASYVTCNNCLITYGTGSPGTFMGNTSGTFLAVMNLENCFVQDVPFTSVLFSASANIGLASIYCDSCTIQAGGNTNMESGNGAIVTIQASNSFMLVNYVITSTDGQLIINASNCGRMGSIDFSGASDKLSLGFSNSTLDQLVVNEAMPGVSPLLFFNSTISTLSNVNVPFNLRNTHVNQGDILTHSILAQTTGYTANVSDEIILVDTSGGAVTINLPISTGTDFFMGQQITVKDSSGNAITGNITVNGNGFTIDGAATKTIITAFGFLTMVFDGTSNWNIIGRA